MPAATDPDLHGSVPDKARAALLLIDVINDMEYPGGDDLAAQAVAMARNIAALKARAAATGIPSIYVNDNFGKWRSDFRRLVEHCLHDGVRGEEAARLLAPGPDDYFVLKPKHSGFYSTTLATLLDHLGARTLILCGIAANNCVVFTAGDAYMRGYTILVPSECVISVAREDNEYALDLMRKVLKADTTASEAGFSLRKNLPGQKSGQERGTRACPRFPRLPRGT